VVVGVCANAIVASNAEPAKPAVTDFTNMMFSLNENGQEKTNGRRGRSGSSGVFSGPAARFSGSAEYRSQKRNGRSPRCRDD
jgi:hypothetical protein